MATNGTARDDEKKRINYSLKSFFNLNSIFFFFAESILLRYFISNLLVVDMGISSNKTESSS